MPTSGPITLARDLAIVFISYCHTEWLKTDYIYYLMVLEVRSPVEVSSDKNQGVGRISSFL